MTYRVCHCVGDGSGICCQDKFDNNQQQIGSITWPQSTPPLRPWRDPNPWPNKVPIAPLFPPKQDGKSVKKIEYWPNGSVKSIEYYEEEI